MSAPKPRFEQLGKRLAEEENALLARHPGPPAFRGASRLSMASREEVDRIRGVRPRRAWVATGIAAFAIAAAAVALVVRSRPLAITVGGEADVGGHWISAPADNPLPLRFSDGTEMMLAPEAHARVLDVNRKGAHVMLESGKATISVTPNRGGQWTFTAGPFNVEVKGTRFAMAWSPREQLFTLTLIEGSVVISGCAVGEGRPLFAGETLNASCLGNEFHIDRMAANGSDAPATTAPAVAGAPLAPSDSTGSNALDPNSDPVDTSDSPSAESRNDGAHATRSSRGSRDSWQSLARASRFREAYARVHDRGFDTELAAAGKDDALLLGDVARLTGDGSRALLAYQKVRARAPGTEAAANAAFSMGRVYFDQQEAYTDAARWFATYRSERASGPLARDAMGRQMEALSRAGDKGAAQRLAEAYVLRYPNGPHAPLARSLRPESK